MIRIIQVFWSKQQITVVQLSKDLIKHYSSVYLTMLNNGELKTMGYCQIIGICRLNRHQTLCDHQRSWSRSSGSVINWHPGSWSVILNYGFGSVLFYQGSNKYVRKNVKIFYAIYWLTTYIILQHYFQVATKMFRNYLNPDLVRSVINLPLGLRIRNSGLQIRGSGSGSKRRIYGSRTLMTMYNVHKYPL